MVRLSKYSAPKNNPFASTQIMLEEPVCVAIEMDSSTACAVGCCHLCPMWSSDEFRTLCGAWRSKRDCRSSSRAVDHCGASTTIGCCFVASRASSSANSGCRSYMSTRTMYCPGKTPALLVAHGSTKLIVTASVLSRTKESLQVHPWAWSIRSPTTTSIFNNLRSIK